MKLFSDGSIKTENNNSSGVRIASLVIVVLTITIAAFSGAVAADTLTVSENETIQEVVDDASDGDTVVISDGEYQEEVTVDTDITLSGDGDVVLDGMGQSLDTAITVEAGSVTVEGLVIQEYDDYGIWYDPPTVADDLQLTVQDTSIVDTGSDAIEVDANNVEADATVDTVEIRNSRNAIDVDSTFGELEVLNSAFISNSNGIVGTPTELTIDGTTIDRSSNYGVEIYGVETTVIADSTITDSRDDDNIYVSDLGSDSEVTVESVTASDADGNGIVIYGAETAAFSDITALSNGVDGIDVEADSVTIENTDVSSNGDEGLDIDADTVTITDVTATDNTDSQGIEIIADTSEISDVDVSGSGDTGWSSGAASLYVEGSETDISGVEATPSNGDHAIETDGLESVSIEDVELSGSSGSNINIVSSSSGENISITDATLSQSEDRRGVYLDVSSSSSIELSDITSTGHGGEGLYIDNGGDISISNVELYDLSDAGFVIEDGGDVTITNADVSNTGDEGILVQDGEEITIADADISNTDFNGIDLRDIGDVSISDADLDDIGDDGIRVDDGDAVDISGVNIDDSNDEGIDIHGASELSITDATVTQSSSDGIYINGLSSPATISDSTITDNGGHEIRNDADRRIDVSDSTVGLLGDVENDDHNYITGNIVLQSGVSTENPDQTSGVSADFTIDPRPAQEDATVTFDASSTQVLGGDATYEWDLTGDGDIDQTGELVDRSFEEGTYDVTLTVEDSEGREDDVTESFEVGPSGINTQITTTRTELTTDEQTAIEFSVTNFLTSEESDVQMIVENPSGVQISSTHNVDQSSNQVTLTETVAPTEQENFRFAVTPTAPGTYEVTAIAEYESEDGTDGSRIEEIAIFEVTEPTDTDSSQSASEQEDDSGSSFWSWVTTIIFFYAIYRLIKWIAS